MTAVHQAPAPGPPAAGPPAQAPAQQPPAPPARRRPRRLVPRTATGRLRAFTAAIIVALLGTLAVTWAAVDDARDGVRVIGHDAGPQVVATGDLYFALTDMDAQLANALLIGRGEGLGLTRAQALERYEADRLKAGTALLQAGKLADEASEDKTAQDLIAGLGRYERLAGQALQLDQQADHAPGPPTQRVIALYRDATDLMKLDLLPKAYNLTLDNGTLVRHTYESERSAVLTGTAWVVVTGVILLAVLVGVQIFLTRRFRRLFNPALALATLATLVLTSLTAMMLLSQAEHLRKAKEDGFDSILALSRARAISNSANADQTRFLLDPGRADTYEQVFLSKSQSVLYLRAGNLAAYNGAVQGNLGDLRKPTFLGFIGTEAKRAATADEGDLPGQSKALPKLIGDWRQFQKDDRQIRDMTVGGRRGQAIGIRMGPAAQHYAAYDASLVKLIQIHRGAFDKAVGDGDGGSKGWDLLIPVAGLVIIVLVLAGVRPRFAEYR